MSTVQQEQTLKYFNQHAGEWRSKAEGAHRVEVNVIEQRNNFVEYVADTNKHTRKFLDVGCGTGELVCNIAKKGISSTGLDYAQEMIDLADKKSLENKIDQASFVCDSIFDHALPQSEFDLVSANGFIEYVTEEQMLEFFKIVYNCLAPQGSFVVGSRNRLFNTVSMNKYTIQEMQSNDFEALVKEAIAWNGADQIADALNTEMAGLQPPEIIHENTGIDVATRFQYTPLQLIRALEKIGFEAVDVYPIHVHGVTPAFGSKYPELHVSISNLLQTYGQNHYSLIMQASSFMLHVKKS